MKIHNLDTMIRGWFIGPFSPSVLKTETFECAIKRYRVGEKEKRHVHLVATEFTVIVEGAVRMNGEIYGANSIIEIEPGIPADFESLSDVITLVIKIPGVPGDKYEF